MKTKLTVDLENYVGCIRPLHGMNDSARAFLWADLYPEFKELNIPIVRLHDIGGAYGGMRYVDIPNVFPDFNADPDDEASYDFTLTDMYIKYLVEAGCEVMYRLGVTIENAPVKYRIFPPSDPYKWADICEHIVRHYNNGWANGYHWNIKYWEIWNEPDGTDPHITSYGPPMWKGTPEQYYELYSITTNHIKKLHPDVKVGGYSACMATGSFKNGNWTFGLTEYIENFFRYITDEKTRAPLDFFSWHVYIDHNIKRISYESDFVQSMLDRYGFSEVENLNTEWNVYLSRNTDERYAFMRNEKGASHCAAALCEMQNNGNVTSAMYYRGTVDTNYGSLFTAPPRKVTKAYRAFSFFNELYQLKNQCRLECDSDKLYALAASNGNEGLILLSNPEDDAIKVNIISKVSSAKKIEISIVDTENDGETVEVSAQALSSLPMSPYSIVMIRITK